MTATDQALLYTYAIVRPKPGTIPQLPDVAIVPESSVELIQLGAYAIAVSTVSRQTFELDLPALFHDAAWVQGRVLAHQAVLTDLTTNYTVLPLRFCTLYRSEAQLRESLGQSAERLTHALDRLEGATEWGVKIYYDAATYASWAIEHASELASLRQQIQQAPAGTAYLLRRKLEQRAQQLADQAAFFILQVCHQQLANHARAAITRDPQPPEAHGRLLPMILNAAYLVPDGAIADIRSQLLSLETRYATQGFQFELTGPWPPYNFAELRDD
jgi:hypothetical protein